MFSSILLDYISFALTDNRALDIDRERGWSCTQEDESRLQDPCLEARLTERFVCDTP
jgi:hypothetical protein